jgi:hypothetical protein
MQLAYFLRIFKVEEQILEGLVNKEFIQEFIKQEALVK